MKILITGALGHIGSALIRHIPKVLPKAELVLIDNMLVQRYCSLVDLPEEGQYEFYQKDVLKDDMDPFIKDADIVVHLAAITDAANSFEKQQEVEAVNLEATKRMAKSCRQHKTKMIFLSTTSVYGTQNSEVDEDCSVEELSPQSPYAKSKRDSELFLETVDQLEYVSLRFGTIFGTSVGMRYHTAVNKFCWQASMGIPLTVWKTALHQHRPYLDLNDAVRSLTFVIENNIFDRKIYNVLTNNCTVNDIVENIKKYIPETEITLVETKIMNQLSYFVKCEKFKSLGFEFQGDLDKAIKETVGQFSAIKNRGKYA